MGLFTPEEKDYIPELRKIGLPRYKELLGQNWKTFFLTGFIAMVYFAPFIAGVIYGVLSKSLIIILIAGVVGGAISGPGVACLYDLYLRRLRYDDSHWWVCWKKSMKNNTLASIFPGIIQCTYIALAVFSVGLMFYGNTAPSLATILLFIFGAIVGTMIMIPWWAQIVLFQQKTIIRLKNAIFFALLHFWKVLLASVIQVGWWTILIFFLPWSAFAVPVLGIWYVIFLSVFILYRYMNKDFRIEEQIRAAFPGVLPDEDEYEIIYPDEDDHEDDNPEESDNPTKEEIPSKGNPAEISDQPDVEQQPEMKEGNENE